MRTRTGVSFVVVLLLVALAAARSNHGEIAGTVRDASGAALPGVNVTLTGIERRSATTGARGEYVFANLPPGSYRVVFELAGFRTVLKPATVRVGRTERLDVRLEAASAEESVSVDTGTAKQSQAAPEDTTSARRDASPPAAGAAALPGGVIGGVVGGLPESPLPPAPPAPASTVATGAPPHPSGGVAGGFGGRYSGPLHTEAYDGIVENPFRRAATDSLSTFSVDVDTASYANVRRFLTSGTLPPPGAVRIEELVNYFRFDYPRPEGDAPFSVTTELAACPWNAKHRLALVGLRGRELAARDETPRNLVFLIDVSGSMAGHDKLPLVRTAMRMLADTLTARDRVAIVVYAGASGLVLPSTPGDHKPVIHRAIAELESGGSTNGAAGITLAYRVAREHFVRGGINRVVLATDGDFNVGVTSQDELIRLIEEQRASGVFLSVLGVGTGNLKDSTMEKLADKGNGNYSYLDSLHEARRVLVREAGGTLVTIAKDVKIQVEFNPAAVAAYRLIGYENRVLRHEDFNDDRKDAGEIGSGHTVTALYEIVPAGADTDVPGVDPLKYQRTPERTPAASSDELLTVKLRYKTPEGDTSRLISTVIRDRVSGLTPNLGFASAIAEFGMLLRRSEYAGSGSYEAATTRARAFRGSDSDGYRAELVKLVELASSLHRMQSSASKSR